RSTTSGRRQGRRSPPSSMPARARDPRRTGSTASSLFASFRGLLILNEARKREIVHSLPVGVRLLQQRRFQLLLLQTVEYLPLFRGFGEVGDGGVNLGVRLLLRRPNLVVVLFEPFENEGEVLEVADP